MINFAIPGMYELASTNMKFLELKKNNPEYFYDNININAVYGNPQFCIWDGGRIFGQYKQATLEEVERIIAIYNQNFNVPIRYVFTNCMLSEEDYYNHFCHLITSLGSNYSNEIVIADNNLRDFLKSLYPNYKFISSTTKCLTEVEKVKQELLDENFFMVCLDYNLNKNKKILETFNPEEKEKIELLVNPICGYKCPQRKRHYELNSASHLNYGKYFKMQNCLIYENTMDPAHKARNITYEDIVNYYHPLGFNYFKIEGRTWNPLMAVLTYCDFMVKPEYHNLVTDFCIGEE